MLQLIILMFTSSCT